MALIQCSECGNEVSDRASACPKCGAPVAAGTPPLIPPPPIPAAISSYPIQGFLCETCGRIGYPKTVTPGSLGIEILLWLFFLVPGLIYSIWRLTNRKKACPHCFGRMIHVTAPRARLLLQQFQPSTLYK